MKPTKNKINFIIECLYSDLYSYKCFIDDMIKKEGTIYKFLLKNESSFEEWFKWFTTDQD